MQQGMICWERALCNAPAPVAGAVPLADVEWPIIQILRHHEESRLNTHVEGALRSMMRTLCDGDGRSFDDGLTVRLFDGVGAHAVCMAASVVSCYSAAWAAF
ncbi:hypothetical protein Tc00.1047053509521.10 [Trypanosoma cruzi]|uniref:Uncharacterized protein n=1 Tax=Trypanosoma cruzi (strain CL Brener) TaxID=353153 RepID=Q4CZ70_TRYCC|nr:hypothetical protein Tc00.1047053509521.10 [Trypanosoma cruzi]EAN85571.1 hypothetical protein Tc00.1047053509521.10 [Trypanosoma cruzi]|eukprot:XP_807422.1 hypothetical protein [Trypanosoma cruzi strain CL Brener]